MRREKHSFSATIVVVAGTTVRPIPVRAFMDNGSNAFFISKRITDRAGLKESDMEREEDVVVRVLEGAACTPKWRTELTWYRNHQRRTRVDTFYVVDDDSFDILAPNSILERDMAVDSIGQEAYILRMRNKTKGECDVAKAELITRKDELTLRPIAEKLADATKHAEKIREAEAEILEEQKAEKLKREDEKKAKQTQNNGSSSGSASN